MKSTMQALRLFKINDLRKVEVSIPAPKPDEVLVRTVSTTICTSDLVDIEHNFFNIPLPITLGHEGAGIVEAVGSNVTTFKKGDPVAAHPVISCGHCDMCNRGHRHLCNNMGHLGFDRDGTFAEYFVIPAERVRLVPDALNLNDASLLEPVCVCIQALERGKMTAGDRLMVVGDGPFGILIGRLAGGYDPESIVIVGRHEFRLGFLPEAARVSDKDLENELSKDSVARPELVPDLAIQAAGNVGAIKLCIESVRPRGRVVIFSNVAGESAINLSRVHIKELEIYGSCNDEDYLDRAMDALSNAHLSLADVITHRLPIDQWEKAFDTARHARNEALKVAIEFT